MQSAEIEKRVGEANLVEGTVDANPTPRGGANGAFASLQAGRVVLHARNPQGAASGALRQLFVRPERIALACDGVGQPVAGGGAPDADPAAGRSMETARTERAASLPGGDVELNVVGGRILRTSFLGNVLRHAVAVDGAAGIVLTVDVQNASTSAPPPLDARVRLTWRAEDSVLL
jgi:hypothetical protein